MDRREMIAKKYAAWLGDEQGEGASDPLTRALDALYLAGPDPKDAEAARAKLRASLQEVVGQIIYYDSLPETPLGTVYLAVNARGLVALNFGISEESFLRALRKRTGAQVQRSPEKTAEYAAQVRQYLAGMRRRFDLPVDLSMLSEFHRQVLQAAIQVPAGQVVTYSEIARQIGRPRAARAVGQALARNPVPLVIPCHRVVAADGSLGGYSGGGGLRDKALLLQMEGARPA